MSESEDEHEPERPDDIPSNVPDPEAPLRGEAVPDNWLSQQKEP
jgi:hypothetical protein